jgi:hypothetical protein
MNDTDNEMQSCAKTLRTAVNNETEVTISRRLVLGEIAKFDFCANFGDILNRGKWRWECVHADTLQECFDLTLAQIMAQGDERNREVLALRDSAAKLGLKIVEATP